MRPLQRSLCPTCCLPAWTATHPEHPEYSLFVSRPWRLTHNLLGASSLQARKEREYTPFPPAPTPRKVDLQLESGEYFLSDEQKRARKQEARDQKQAEASAASAAKRQARFVAPKEAAARPAAAKRKPAEERSVADLAATLRGKDAAGKKRRVRGGQGV